MNKHAVSILVVDDNEEMRAFLREQLDECYQVFVASDGEEGWARIQETSPDLVISDVRMPGMDGETLCQRVKDDPDLPFIPIILLAENSNGEENALEVDADDVLSKPFALEELRQRIGQFLPTRELPDIAGIEQSASFFRRVVRVIERRLHSPDFTTGELADAVALSRRQLTRRLKKEMGKTPAALIRECRIERAKARLKQNPSTIADVGTAVGFRSASHFSQVFRQHVGCSPSTYLKRHTA